MCEDVGRRRDGETQQPPNHGAPAPASPTAAEIASTSGSDSDNAVQWIGPQPRHDMHDGGESLSNSRIGE